ncbi:MAG: hypothetical protein JO261_11865 [Alphaproteobacteria bacterium]|nr:hypothetical protein [Alphaproteobacteria bacterium]MBV9694386.1 hypothetical protein [Alphaproteobacteria bacterium]
MPHYEINYLAEDGHLTCKFAAQCERDVQAKVLAHAMRAREFKFLEVWSDGAMIYARPDNPPWNSAALRR